MTLAERIARRLRAAGHEVPEDAVLRRTYAGWAQRSAGAWSWTLSGSAYGGLTYGSQWPATVVARCQDWTVGRELHGADDEHRPVPCLR